MWIWAYLSTIILLLLLLRLLRTSKSKSNLPPGPLRLPIIGSSLQIHLADPAYPHRALEKLAQKYGDIMGYGMGVHYAVVISSYEKMKRLFKMEELTESRFPFAFVKDRNFGEEHSGIIWGNWKQWSTLRRLTAKSFKDLQRTVPFEAVMASEMEGLGEGFLREAAAAKENCSCIQISQTRLGLTAINVLWSFVGGFTFSSEDPVIFRHLRHNNTTMEILSAKTLYNIFPFLKRLFPGWSGARRHAKMFEELQDFMRGMLEDAKSRFKGEESSNFMEEFLEKIEAAEKEGGGDGGGIYTEKQLLVVLMDLFLAGGDTISKLMEWTILLFALYPEVQDRIQEELKNFSGVELGVKSRDWSKFPYVKATFYEVLRITNLVPWTHRMTSKDVQFDGYTIPKGAFVHWNMTPILGDKGYWGDPDTFRPSRFLNENNEIIREKGGRVMGIFGVAPRVCLGETFTADMFLIFVTTMLKKMNFACVPGNLPSTDPVFSSVLHPEPFSVKIIPLTFN